MSTGRNLQNVWNQRKLAYSIKKTWEVEKKFGRKRLDFSVLLDKLSILSLACRPVQMGKKKFDIIISLNHYEL